MKWSVIDRFTVRDVNRFYRTIPCFEINYRHKYTEGYALKHSGNAMMDFFFNFVPISLSIMNLTKT